MSTTDKPTWQLAEQICEVPAVDEAIRTFVEDNTGDNATGIVLAVLEYQAATEAAKATGTAGEQEPWQALDFGDVPFPGHWVASWPVTQQRGYIDGYRAAVKAEAARQPAPALPMQEQILKARQEGRMEAMEIITRQDAESPFDDQVTWRENGDAGDYSAYWNEVALRELLHIDDSAYNAFDKAEAEYWDYRGYAIECENAEVQRRAALAATAAPVLSDEQIDEIWKELPWPDMADQIEFRSLAKAKRIEFARAVIAATRSQS